ncbi:MAG TPA: hydroxyacylglutathione hydrolase [Hyphomicrobiaceae bacterium]|jgi:hydroxyacylglutathione hydrolase|nr:hydroxyacylglutathione hydrolase [Hyphomicrobiaceae bacterium]
MGALQIYQFPCLSDNFGVLIHDPEGRVTASIDAPEADKVSAALAEKGWKLTHILTTHHHADHTGGNARLKAETGCRIIGPRNEAAKIPGIDEEVGEGDTIQFGAHRVQVLDTPGHTAGQVNYFIPSAKAAFCGDTLFAMGCGRVIEGTPQMMWTSLKKLMALPKDTSVYCGHEYTQANARFALTIEPDSAALQTRAREVDATRAAGKATLPTSIGLELETNPFLRPHVPAIQKLLGMEGRPEWEIFAEIRERKNRF